ncbi:hypothetical protein AOLI_G00223510 [Acnodon oligacanthus]
MQTDTECTDRTVLIGTDVATAHPWTPLFPLLRTLHFRLLPCDDRYVPDEADQSLISPDSVLPKSAPLATEVEDAINPCVSSEASQGSSGLVTHKTIISPHKKRISSRTLKRNTSASDVKSERTEKPQSLWGDRGCIQ